MASQWPHAIMMRKEDEVQSQYSTYYRTRPKLYKRRAPAVPPTRSMRQCLSLNHILRGTARTVALRPSEIQARYLNHPRRSQATAATHHLLPLHKASNALNLEQHKAPKWNAAEHNMLKHRIASDQHVGGRRPRHRVPTPLNPCLLTIYMA